MKDLYTPPKNLTGIKNIVVNGKEFTFNAFFSIDRWNEFLASDQAKRPVVFLGNLHTTPTVEYGFIVQETAQYMFVKFMENIIYFCETEFGTPVTDCVTPKACSKSQCFVVPWDKLDELNKPYLVDRKPVDSTELIQMAKDNGYQKDGLYFTSQAAAVLRSKGYTVEENNYLKFKHKL